MADRLHIPAGDQLGLVLPVDGAELEAAIRDFVTYYNNRRYHESLNNCTPADVYYDRHREVLSERDKIKRLTMERRKKEYRAANAA